MKFGSLFAGIGGFDLGLERAGMECVWQVEKDPYCNKVLAKHWPDVRRFEDVREVGRDNLEPVELIVGGFPCQPFSVAGKRQGKDDDRHLWPEMLRIITELRPTWVIGENVAGLVNLGLDGVLSDLEAQGYETRTFNIPASAVGAYHQRQRLWIVGYSDGARAGEQGGHVQQEKQASGQREWQRLRDVLEPAGQDVADSDQLCLERGGDESQSCQTGGREEKPLGRSDGGNAANTTGTQPQRTGQGDKGAGRQTKRLNGGCRWEAEPDVGRVVDGLPSRVDRLKCLGNAVVPQIPEILGRAIMEVNKEVK
jgi:DNA (cytosine-5)-methyltransferase 1